MLEVIFCNVGDGDACLIREKREGRKDYVLLVDAGRPALEFVSGSCRREALYHLRNFGIDRIDLCVITHLHIDHFGGLDNILRHVKVDKILTPYLPPEDGQFLSPPYHTGVKRLIGLSDLLNIWKDTVTLAGAVGTAVEKLLPGRLMLTPELSMDTDIPLYDDMLVQHQVFDNLFHGIENEFEIWHNASMNRNIYGPLTLLSYAGRRILLTADVYASEWEETEFAPCDILKLPHHGDPKSMTAYLNGRLHPRYAVVSCQNDPAAKKDRPSADIVKMIQQSGTEVLCTENKPMPTMAAATHWDVRFEISDTGSIACFTD